MKAVQCLIMTGVIVLLLACVVSGETALAQELNIDSLVRGLPESSQDLLEEINQEEDNFVSNLFELLKEAAEEFFLELQGGVRMALRLFFTLMLCQLAEVICEQKGKNVVIVAGTLALASICLTEIRSMVDVGRGTMLQLTDFNMALNPIMAAAATASGAASGAGMNYGLTVFFSNMLLQLGTYFIIPGIYGYIVLGLTDAVLREDRLKKLRELVGWSVEHILKLLVYTYTGGLTLAGVLTGATDSAKLKAAKTAISGMLPVVGGIVSGAAETILAGAAVLRNTVGTFGLLAILTIFLGPFIKMSVIWLVLKVTSALSGVFMGSLTGFLETVSKAAGYFVAMIGSSAVICLLSCCCYFKVVQL